MYSLVMAAMLTVGAESPNGCWGVYAGGGFSYNWGGCGWGWGGWPGWCGCGWPGWYGYRWPGCYGPWGWWGGSYPAYFYPSWYGTPFYGYFGQPIVRGNADTAESPPAAESLNPSPTRATVKVELPEDAGLYVDGRLVDRTSSTRTIVTPELQEGRDYHYNLKAEWTRDGKTVTDSRRVAFQPGKVIVVQFRDTPADTRANAPGNDEAPAHITVRVPAETKLYVDGVPCPVKAGVCSFDTPPLPLGKKFFYVLKTENVRSGEIKTEARKVSLEAGKNVEVEFGKPAAVSTND